MLPEIAITRRTGSRDYALAQNSCNIETGGRGGIPVTSTFRSNFGFPFISPMYGPLKSTKFLKKPSCSTRKVGYILSVRVDIRAFSRYLCTLNPKVQVRTRPSMLRTSVWQQRKTYSRPCHTIPSTLKGGIHIPDVFRCDFSDLGRSLFTGQCDVAGQVSRHIERLEQMCPQRPGNIEHSPVCLTDP